MQILMYSASMESCLKFLISIKMVLEVVPLRFVIITS